MKHILPFTLLLLTAISMCSCVAEKKMSMKGFQNERYNLVVPKEWQRKGVALNAITELLEQTMPKLKGKGFCFNCDALYTVDFEIDSFKTIVNTTTEQVHVFNARFVVSDTSQKRLSSLLVVNRNEDQMIFYGSASRHRSNVILSSGLYNSIQDVPLAQPGRLNAVSLNPDNGLYLGPRRIPVAGERHSVRFIVPNIDQKILNKYILDRILVIKGYLDDLANTSVEQ